MSKSLLLTILATLLAFSTVLSSGPAIADNDHPSSIYLALGDSLAYGVGATDPDSKGYVPIFHEKKLDNLVLSNLAEPGETTTTLVSNEQLEAGLQIIDDPNSDILVVTLDIGANDLLGLLAPSSPCAADLNGLSCQLVVISSLNNFASGYTKAISSLAASLANDPGNESFLVMTYYNPFDGTGSIFEEPIDGVLLGSDGVIDCTASGAARGLNDIIICIGGLFGATIVNVHPLFDNKALKLTHIGEGDTHPNNRGHKTIAKAFQRAVELAQDKYDDGD